VPRRDTRAALVEAAIELFGSGGYGATGVQAITERARVPRGSFYYFFPSKETLAVAALDRYGAVVAAELERCLADPSLGPFDRLARFFEGWAARLEAGGCETGCLVGDLAQEVSRDHETLRAATERVFETWTALIAGCLVEAGRVPTAGEARVLATFLLASWEGAILRMKAARGPEPLRAFFEVLF
jgi:TetR/AcrR family transcriptional repressor of nem operon